jgi:hypothetical protein
VTTVRFHVHYLWLGLAAAAFALTPMTSVGETPPPTPAPTIRTPVVPPIAVSNPLAPKLIYPASGVAYEQGSYPHVKVFIKWEWTKDESDIQGWSICFFKEGSTCGPVGTWHFGKAAFVRKADINFPVMVDSLKWRWKVGRKRKTGGVIDWSEERPITIYPRPQLIELESPADVTTVMVPGTLTFKWKPTSNTEYYLLCSTKGGFSSWEHCPDPSSALGTNFTIKTTATEVTRTFSTAAEVNTLIGSTSDPSAVRKWGVSACRVVQEQSDVDGGQPPVTATHCQRSNRNIYTVKRSP